MLPIDQLVNGSLADAVEYLSKQAAHVRSDGLTHLEKRAMKVSDILHGIGGYLENPVVSKALRHGGIGAAVGGGLGATIGGGKALLSDEKDKPRNFLRKALSGGLAGAAAGGGLGLANSAWSSPGSGGKGDAGFIGDPFGHIQSIFASKGPAAKPPTQFTHGGKTYQAIDRGKSKEYDEFMDLINRNSNASSGVERALSSGIKAITPDKINTPVSAIPAAGMFVSDLASHAHAGGTGIPTMLARSGNWLKELGAKQLAKGNKVRSWLPRALGNVAEFGGNWLPGIVNPRDATSYELLRDGIKNELSSGNKNLPEGRRAAYEHLLSDQGKSTLQELSRKAVPDSKNVDVTHTKLVPELVRKETHQARIVPGYTQGGVSVPTEFIPAMIHNPNTGAMEPNPKALSFTQEWKDMPKTVTHSENMHPEHVRDLRQKGVPAAPVGGGPVHLRRGWFQGIKPSVSGIKGSLGRGLIYGGIPLTEMAIRNYFRDMGNYQTLEQALKDPKYQPFFSQVHENKDQ